jgi:UDP-4-amino-4-deoxy-L-arabinose formyltransferase/UDP-glucuronic acid dehydrogenase (UDP-4-keto-hexauronic acid decarboxylating)
VNVLLVAEESAGVQALRLLADRGERVVGVLTSSSPGRGSAVAIAAGQLGVGLHDPDRVRDPAFADWITAEKVDLLLNVHSLRIADGAVLDAPRIGSFNLHPGPLPRYAGLNAPSWAIAAGERRHAVTVHHMAPAVDAGPIAYEAWFDIAPSDTGLRVAMQCVRLGIPLLARLLDDAARGDAKIPAVEQDPAERRWFGREVPYGGRLPWNEPARRIADLVRAADYAPFPSPWGQFTTSINGVEFAVVRVTATDEPADAPPGTVGVPRPNGVPVAAADAWVLVERLRLDGGAVDPRDALQSGRRCEPLG